MSDQWNWSLKCSKSAVSDRQLTPLGQSGGAVLLEGVAAVQVAVLIEVIVDRGADVAETLAAFDFRPVGPGDGTRIDPGNYVSFLSAINRLDDSSGPA